MQPAWRLAGFAAFATLAACASYPQPVQRMADAEAAARTAQETGAASIPQAQLHLRLAQEEIAQAKQLIANGDNKRADFTLIRAKADAELAIGETRAQAEQAKAQKIIAEAAALQTTTSTSTTPTSITSTTSATVPTPTNPPSTTTTTTIQTQETKP